MHRCKLLLAMVCLLGPVTVIAADAPLSQGKVEDYIETRIETKRLQDRMRANADQYDDLVRAFYRKRAELLRARGWSPDGFDATQERIFRVQGQMERAPELRERKRKDIADLERLRESGQLEEERVENMIRQVKKDYAEEEAKIERTKPDWPAVRPCREELEQLNDWVADNGAKPPEPEC